MRDSSSPRNSIRRLLDLFGWTRHSTVLLGGFLLVCGLIVYVWWPLARQVLAYMDWGGQWWRYFDWLLVGIFTFMTLTIMSRADLRTDALIVFVGILGGLVIESWGTQTNLWHYFTAERPPIWIIPAWPIASLSIDRITRLLNHFITKVTTLVPALRASASAGKEHKEEKVVIFESFVFKSFYWLIFLGFLACMLVFVAPTLDKTFTLVALLLCVVFILTPTDHRYAVLTFLAGAGLGYFLELWGTTRECWTYYTYQTPPFFAVLAHGMAAVAFWRGGLLVKLALEILRRGFRSRGQRMIRNP
jgi:hypothetical protein